MCSNALRQVRMLNACEALSDFLVEVGCAIDGGKDSLSMAAVVQGKKVASSRGGRDLQTDRVFRQ